MIITIIIKIIMIIINDIDKNTKQRALLPHRDYRNITWTQWGNRIKLNKNIPVNFLVRTFSYLKQY